MQFSIVNSSWFILMAECESSTLLMLAALHHCVDDYLPAISRMA